jgi:hypothetical protein
MSDVFALSAELLTAAPAEAVQRILVDQFDRGITRFEIVDDARPLPSEAAIAYVRFSRQLVDQMLADDEWSLPVLVKLERQTDGTYDLRCQRYESSPVEDAS